MQDAKMHESDSDRTSATQTPSKTLLLCFIHGFKGDAKTFHAFPTHLQALLSAALPPSTTVLPIVYPPFATRGDLALSVSALRGWLIDQVIDLEVAAGTSNPMLAPSVHVVLVGHSMGGIVAADAALGIAGERVVRHEGEGRREAGGALFPDVRGVLAFDTPYLGISPSVLAYGAEAHYQTASAALAQLGGLGLFSAGAGAAAGGSGAASPTLRSAGQLAAGADAKKEKAKEEKAKEESGGWGGWGKVALLGGAAVLAAGGAAAYAKRREIGEGVGWATSHLAFVGCLMRPEELRGRVGGMEGLCGGGGGSGDVRMAKKGGGGVGWVNLYTKLGRRAQQESQKKGAAAGGVGLATGMAGRTFCNLPRSATTGAYWKEAVNDDAVDEVMAHMNMFSPAQNPGYNVLAQHAASYILDWTAPLFEASASEASEASKPAQP